MAKELIGGTTTTNLPDLLRDSGAVLDAVQSRITSEAMNALQVALGLMNDDRLTTFGTPVISGKVKADIAFRLLAIAGYVAPRAQERRGAEIPLHEMSVAELRDLASELGAEIADRATPITTPTDAKALDSLM